MLRIRAGALLWRAAVVFAVAAALTACAFSRNEKKVDRTPVMNTGVGATILYPGQPPPRIHPTTARGYPATGESAQPGATGDGATSGTSSSSQNGPRSSTRSTGTGAPSGGGVTFIGGAQSDEKGTYETREDPQVLRWVALPLIAVLAPFKLAADALRGDEPEPAAAPPATAPAPPPAPPSQRGAGYDALMLEQMEAELAERRAAPPAPRAPDAPSIADELAALEGAPPSRPSPPSPPRAAEPRRGPDGRDVGSAQKPRGPANSLPPADGTVDRDGDGHTDQWLYREDGRLVFELLDEDGDERPDRALRYDAESGEVSRIEEDTDGDGAIDAWTDYRRGRVVRRRTDADLDGQVDSWTFYRDGEIVRHERDTTGDGFRDRVGHYADGALDWEEQDRDGDGRAEVIVRYGPDARPREVEEDTDGDGHMDVVSHYEGGRLVRRELLDPALLHDAAAAGAPR